MAVNSQIVKIEKKILTRIRLGRTLRIDWIQNQESKQKSPRGVIRAVVNKKIVPIYDHFQVLDELQEIWNMFWKALDEYFEMNKSSNQKIHQKSSKNGMKFKKTL